MLSDPIFKRDSKGKVRVWQYEVKGSSWRVIAGLQDGKKVTSDWSQSEANSLRNPEEQAIFEADADRKKKLKKDYKEKIEDIDDLRNSTIKPMLAEKFADYGLPSGISYSQPKLDGIRCIINAQGMWSRENRPLLGAPHIFEALKPAFEKNPDLVTDGELYNHDLKDDFNEITSIVKNETPNEEELKKSKAVMQYHIYDIPSHDTEFYGRYCEMGTLNQIVTDPSIVFVKTESVLNKEGLDKLYDEYLEQGYEGQMIRTNNMYQQKRTKFLLKRKEFEDAEFPIVRIEEGKGNWAGYAKRVTVLLEDGQECGCGVKGTRAQTKKILADRDKYKFVTIRFQKRTPDNSLKFPVAVAFYETLKRL